MKLEMKRLDNGIKQIKLAGRLDLPGTSEIENLFTAHAAGEKAKVLVDMAEVTFIASIGMRRLVGGAKAQARRGGKMVLFKPTPLVREALENAGLTDLIPIYDDFEAASAALDVAVSD